MLSRSSLCDLIEPAIRELGLELFDVDLPTAKSGILRIFIARAGVENSTSETQGETGEDSATKSAERNGVTLDDCALVSRTVSGLPGFEEMLPGGVTLEVSSPGINRKLRTEQHFRGAVGEHVRIKHTDEGNKKSVVKGVLAEFDGVTLKLKELPAGEVTLIPFENIDEARVEFLFQ